MADTRINLRLPRDLAAEIRKRLIARDLAENRRHSQNAYLVALIQRGLDAEKPAK
jgi:hypothetical protein